MNQNAYGRELEQWRLVKKEMVRLFAENMAKDITEKDLVEFFG